MPNKVINIPSVGPVNFPDNMSDQDIAQAIQKNYPHLRPPAAQNTERTNTVSAGGATGLSTYNPTGLDRLKQIFTAGVPRYSDKTVNDPTYGKPQLIQPEAAMSPAEQAQHPVLTGVGQVLGGLTTPENTALAAGTFGIGGTAGRIIGLGFGAQMVANAAKAHKQARQASARGDKGEATRLNTIALMSGTLALAPMVKDMGTDAGAAARPTTPLETIEAARRTPEASAVTPAPEAKVPRTIEMPPNRSAKVAADAPPPPVAPPRPADLAMPEVGAPQQVGEKQAKIESADVSKNTSWKLQEYGNLIDRVKKVIDNPKAPPDQVAMAKNMLESLQQQRAEYSKTLAPAAPNPVEPGAPPDSPAEKLLGPQATLLKPGEELPRDIKPIKSVLPPRTPVAEPTEAAGAIAQPAKAETPVTKPAASLDKPGPLTAALARGSYAQAQLNRSDLSPEQRANYTNTLASLKQLANQHLTNWANDLGPQASDAAAKLRATNTSLEPKIDYLAKHLEQRGKIAELRQYQIDKNRLGGEQGARHVPRDASGRPIIDAETGQPIRAEGNTPDAREALANMLGDRRETVPNPKALNPTSPLPEHLQNAQDEVDELKETIAGGHLGPNEMDDALDKINLNSRLISEYKQGLTKSRTVGKAVSIDPQRQLAVMTSEIWERDYDERKGSKWDDEGILRDKLHELETTKKQNEVFANYLDKRASEAGAISPRVLGGIAIGAVAGGVIGGPIGAAIGGVVGGIATGVDTVALRYDIADIAKRAGVSFTGLANLVRDSIAPVSNDPAITDPLSIMRGEIDRRNAVTMHTTQAYIRAGDKLSKDEVIAFHDLYKAGIQQNTPEWEDYAQQIKKPIDTRKYAALEAAMNDRAAATGASPKVLTILQNHDRIMWRDPEKATRSLGRQRSLYGDRGMLKQHVLNSMGEGIAAGLEPVEWNPVLNDHLAWGTYDHFTEGLKYTTHIINAFKKGQPGAEWVKFGSKPTDDSYKEANTNELTTYFPASSGEGMIEAGSWFLHPEIARMLNNYMSKDYIRQYALGRMAMQYKAAAGQWNLFGLFHAFTIAGVSTGLQAGLGAQEIWNGAAVDHDLTTVMQGLRDLATSPAGVITQYKNGKLMAEAGMHLDDYQAWLQTPAGKKFSTLFPNGEELSRLIWHGGGSNGYKTDSLMSNRVWDEWMRNLYKTKQAFDEKRLATATGRAAVGLGTAIPASLSLSMKYLFETVIPAIKLGHEMQDLSANLMIKAPDILAGKTTPIEIARDTVRRTEDALGEYNTNNLWLNNTLRSTLTMFYRSFGWVLGTAESGVHAASGQAKEFVDAARDKRAPRMNGDFAAWLGILGVTALAGGVTNYLFTKKAPHGLDFIAPRIGGEDKYGHPRRVWTPGYASTVWSMLKDPTNIVTGHHSDMLRQLFEALNNKNSAGEFIADPSKDPTYKRFIERMLHVVSPFDKINWNGHIPVPGTFVQRAVQQFEGQGVSTREAIEMAVPGLTPAYNLELSPAEKEAQRIAGSRSIASEGPYTPEQTARFQALDRLTAMLRNQDKGADRYFDDENRAGVLQDKDYDTASNTAFDTNAYLKHFVEKAGFRFDDVLSVYKKATPAEQDDIRPTLDSKYDSESKKATPSEQERLDKLYNQIQ